MVADPRDAVAYGTGAPPELAGDLAHPAGTAAGAPTARQSSLWRDAWRRYTRNRAAMVAGAIFLIILLWALIWPLVSPYDPDATDFTIANQSPSLEHPFGTDKFGRDLFTRAALGTRVSIFIGFGATLAILLIGVV